MSGSIMGRRNAPRPKKTQAAAPKTGPPPTARPVASRSAITVFCQALRGIVFLPPFCGPTLAQAVFWLRGVTFDVAFPVVVVPALNMAMRHISVPVHGDMLFLRAVALAGIGIVPVRFIGDDCADQAKGDGTADDIMWIGRAGWGSCQGHRCDCSGDKASQGGFAEHIGSPLVMSEAASWATCPGCAALMGRTWPLPRLTDKNCGALWDNIRKIRVLLLNIRPLMRSFAVMKYATFIIALLAILALTPDASAQSGGCYADYKAQRTKGGSLKLHYGVIKLGKRACSNPATAERQVSRRIASEGWQLLRVMSTFDASGLSQRQGNAGKFYLRY